MKSIATPFTVSRLDWFYAGGRHFCFIHQVWLNGTYIRADTTQVKTSHLVSALVRLGLVVPVPAKKGTPRKRRAKVRK